VVAGDLVKIESVVLEKCRQAELIPLSPNYLQIDDLRALLESHLRKYYSTLYKGLTIQVGFGRDQVVNFQIYSLKPADACICLNTDIEIEIRAENELMAMTALKSKMGMGVGTKEWIVTNGVSKMMFDRLKVDTNTILKLPLLKITQYKFDLQIHTGDVNIFISENETPSVIDHLVMSVDQGSRLFYVDTSKIKGGFLYINIEKYGFGECECSLVVESVSDIVDEMQMQAVTNSSSLAAQADTKNNSISDMEKCGNCGLLVPSRTITMHFAFCSRNNQPCPKCDQVFLKNEFEKHWHCDQCSKVGDIGEKIKHVEFWHQFVTCSCGETLYPPQVAQHKLMECVDRFIICRYCHLLLPAGKLSKTGKDLILGLGLTEHESDCGARTFQCQSCSKSVQLKGIWYHCNFR
jgi:Ubiquitin fusion degradation protein UFD1